MNSRLGATLIVMMLALTSVQGQTPEIHYDHNTDFKGYKTYAWRERRLMTQQGKEVEQVIDQALVRAVNAQLQLKGLKEDNNAPDFFLTYRGGTTVTGADIGQYYDPTPYDPAVLASADVWWTNNPAAGSVPNVWVSMQGVLLFEIADAKTKTVTWSSLLRKKIKRPGKMPKDLDKSAGEIAKKAFQAFPPKK